MTQLAISCVLVIPTGMMTRRKWKFVHSAAINRNIKWGRKKLGNCDWVCQMTPLWNTWLTRCHTHGTIAGLIYAKMCCTMWNLKPRLKVVTCGYIKGIKCNQYNSIGEGSYISFHCILEFWCIAAETWKHISSFPESYFTKSIYPSTIESNFIPGNILYNYETKSKV